MKSSLKELIVHCKIKKIYIYGAGNYGRTVLSFLREHNIAIAGFVESDGLLTCSQVMGEQVFCLSQVAKDSCIVVCAGSNSRRQIEENLHNGSFTDYILLTSENIMDICNEVDYKNCIPLKNKINVLVYHRIVNGIKYDTWHLSVDVKNFERHIKYIKDNYQVIRLDDDWESVSENSIVITFDDGYADNYWNALPILEKYQVPATVFVSTKNIGTTNLFFWDYIENCIMGEAVPNHFSFGGEQIDLTKSRIKAINFIRDVLKMSDVERRKELMVEFKRNVNFLKVEDKLLSSRTLNFEEIRKMSSSQYISIGAHGVTHSNFARMSFDDQNWEISESKKMLENAIDKEVNLFSYPFGGKLDYTDETVSILKENGFKKAVANWRGLADKKTDPFQIPRTKIYDGSEGLCAREIRGTYCMYSD